MSDFNAELHDSNLLVLGRYVSELLDRILPQVALLLEDGGDLGVGARELDHATTGAGVDAAIRRDERSSRDPSDLSRHRDLMVVPRAPASPSGPAPAGK